MTNAAGPHFVLSGFRGDTSPLSQGTFGYYWSSFAWTSATSAYSLRFLYGPDSSVSPAYGNNKRNGFALRCLGNTTGEFQSLYTQYPTHDQMRKYPVGMVLNGRYYWSDGTLSFQGTGGFYWSSSAYTSATLAYGLYLGGTHSTVYPAGDYNKRYGYSLRCLACRLAFYFSYVWFWCR